MIGVNQDGIRVRTLIYNGTRTLGRKMPATRLMCQQYRDEIRRKFFTIL